MFFHGKHKELTDSIEAIGASFAVYEYSPATNTFLLISCNSMYEELLGKNKEEVISHSVSTIFPQMRWISMICCWKWIKLCMQQKRMGETKYP